MVGKFVVFGLGRFGHSLVLHLARSGHSVLAVDRNPKLVQDLATEIDRAICVDSTDEQALLELNLREMTCAVVAIGADATESSILTTALLRQIGIPYIVGRATSELHARVLLAVGAHKVVNPEEAMGRQVARQLAHPKVFDQLDLADDAELAEIELPQAWVGQSLMGLRVRQEYQVSVLGVRRDGKLKANLSGQEKLQSGDTLVVIGPPQATTRLSSLT